MDAREFMMNANGDFVPGIRRMSEPVTHIAVIKRVF
jgi:hypothetical protein